MSIEGGEVQATPQVVDVQIAIDEAIALVQEGKGVPFSASAIVHRADLLNLLVAARNLLPQDLDQAKAVLTQREAVIEEGRYSAEQFLIHAREEASRMVEETAVVNAARDRADEIIQMANEDAEAIKLETDTYVDNRLATLEVVLTKTMDAITRGRARLAGEKENDGLVIDE